MDGSAECVDVCINTGVVSTVGVMSQAMRSSGIMKLAKVNSQHMIIGTKTDNCNLMLCLTNINECERLATALITASELLLYTVYTYT